MSGMKIEFDHFAEIAVAAIATARSVVQKTVFDIEAGAKQNAPVDTGALKNSIQGQMTGPAEGEVDVGAEYGAYQEYGTYKMAAQPYLVPAVEVVRPAWDAAMKQVIPEKGL